MKKITAIILVLMLFWANTINVFAVENFYEERNSYIYNYTGDPYDKDKSDLFLGSFYLTEDQVVSVYTATTGIYQSSFRFYRGGDVSTSYVIGGNLGYVGSFVVPASGYYSLHIDYKNASGTITIQIV